MVKFLKWLTHFLETRFPERIVVSSTDYYAIDKRLEALEAMSERIQKIEMTVNAHSQMMGLGMTGKLGLTGNLER